MKLDSDIAKLCALWLAEGDNKTNSEITFTNNDRNLILFFHSNITRLLNFKNLPRLYVYSPSKNQRPALPINITHKYYVDERASKPYFIYRVSGVEAVKKWKSIVDIITNKKKFYPFILQGFFAGEGSLKFHLKSKSRTLRISQGNPNLLIESILNSMNIPFEYIQEKRNYEIRGRNNLEKLKSLNISIMHSEKHKKFLNMMNSYKQYHYKSGYLKKEIFNILTDSFSTSELAKKFKRSKARINRILLKLKKERKVLNYRVKSKSYWIREDQNLIIISKRKERILKFLKAPKLTSEIAKNFDINWKAASRRLKELKKLNLVTKDNNGYWRKNECEKKLIAI
jgi:predicted transcriptional regulator